MKTALKCILTLFVVVSTYGEPLELIQRYVGSDAAPFDFVLTSVGEHAPFAAFFADGGELVVYDVAGASDRLARIDLLSNSSEYEEMTVFTESPMALLDDLIVSGAKAFTQQGEVVANPRNFSVGADAVGFNHADALYVRGYSFFVEDRAGRPIGAVRFEEGNPSPVEYLDEAAVIERFAPGREDTNGIVVDRDGNLFVDGHMMGPGYRRVSDYHSHGYDVGAYFGGTDSAGVTHWLTTTGSWGVNETGEIVFAASSEIVQEDPHIANSLRDEFGGANWAIVPVSAHPSGDVHFLAYSNDEARLYRIPNTWNPEARAAWYAEHGELPAIATFEVEE